MPPTVPGGGQPPGALVPGHLAGQGQPALYPPEDVEPGKLLAIASYVLLIVAIIPLVQRDNAFSLYHAKQALVFLVVGTVASIPIGIVASLTCGIGVILYLPLFYPWIMGIVNAANGRYQPVPWIGRFADQFLGTLVADKRPPRP